MPSLFQFKIPHRWKLQRRSYLSTPAAKITQKIEDISNTQPQNKGTCARNSETEEDYLFIPIGASEEDQETLAETKPDTAQEITLPLEVFNSLENQLSTAQLGQTRVKALEEKCERMAKELEQAQGELRSRDECIEAMVKTHKAEKEKKTLELSEVSSGS
jgi:hypothetical protein